MENEPETITQTRVRLYREALAQLREENALKEAEAATSKKNEAEKAPEEPRPDHDDTTTHGGTARGGSDKA